MEGAELGKRSATSELRREKHMKSTGKGEKLPRDKKAPVGGDDDVYVIDEFDSTKPIDMEKDICAMCKEVTLFLHSLCSVLYMLSFPFLTTRDTILVYFSKKSCHKYPTPALLLSMMMVTKSF